MRFVWLLMALACHGPTPTDDTGPDCVDADGDGSTDCEDCDDNDPNTYPGAEERCDGLDNNCDGLIVFEGNDGQDCQLCDDHDLFALTQTSYDLSGAIREATASASCTYSQATRYMFTALDKSDGQVECVYTGRKVTVGSDKPDADDMNTEHTWPQSQGAQALPAKCDLHHLFPTDATANTKRADLPLDEVISNVDWSEGGSQLGRNSDGDDAFEPRDAHKGNAARAMLYFATRYAHTLPRPRLQTYLSWHQSDPVDDAEINRTDDIARRQGNPNPFVYCPILVEQLTDAP